MINQSQIDLLASIQDSCIDDNGDIHKELAYEVIEEYLGELK